MRRHLDRLRGPMLLELNARPGLAIQVANQAGLEHRLLIAAKIAADSSLADGSSFADGSTLAEGSSFADGSDNTNQKIALARRYFTTQAT